MTSSPPSQSAFTVLDWIGWILTGVCVMGLALFPIVGQNFSRMFDDFASRSNLPLLTELAVSYWFPPALAISAGAFLVIGLRTRLSLFQRRVLVIFAFVIACGASAICLKGLYMPIVAVADAIS